MDILHSLGYIAGLCTTMAFLPQVYQTYRTRHAHDISYGMLLLLSTGVALWFIYGLVIGDIPVVYANGITLILLLILTGMKVTFP
ncbi:MAG: SemiSWEET transporter [Methanobacteriota archaeon]